MTQELMIKKKNKQKFYLLGGFLLVVGLVLLVLPATYFDEGHATCLSVLLFDKTCYGCGMTRAIQHMIHLDFKAAYEFNKLSVIVLPLFIYMFYTELRKLYLASK